MAAFGSPVFSSAVAYTLACLGQQDIVLKEKQFEAIKSIYEGEDAFVWLPMGYGKLLCYQLLHFLFDFKLGRTGAIATECCSCDFSPRVIDGGSGL